MLIGPLRTRGVVTKANPSPWLNHVMQIFALFMFLGIFTTLLLPETKRKTLEELAGEVEGTPNYDSANGPTEGARTGSSGVSAQSAVAVGEKNV